MRGQHWGTFIQPRQQPIIRGTETSFTGNTGECKEMDPLSMEMLGASLINDQRRAGEERCNNDVENIPLILPSTWAGPITQQSWTKSRMWINCTKTRPVLCRLPGLPNIVQKEMIFTFFLGQTAFVTGKKFVGRVLTPGRPALRPQILIVGHVLHFSLIRNSVRSC